MLNKIFLENDGLIVGNNQLTTSGGGVGIGQNLVVSGNTYSSGIITNNLQLNNTASIRTIIENANFINNTGISGITPVYVANSAITYYQAPAIGNFGFNFTYDTYGNTINNAMITGQSISLVVLVPQGNSSYFATSVYVDGNAVTPYWLGGSVPATGDAFSIDVYSFTILKTGNQSFNVLANQTKFAQLIVNPGQQTFTTVGSNSWTAPAGVYSVSVVAVGGGGGGYYGWASAAGAGGGLGWINNFTVIPGQTYNVTVGGGGSYNGGQGGNSYFNNLTTVAGYGGGNSTAGANSNGPNANGYGGGWYGNGGGAGGQAGFYNVYPYAGGGGAGGYTGNGGTGGYPATGNSPTAGSGGGGGGGSMYSSTYGTGAGGGVGILGQGANGAAGSTLGIGYGGGGGSGGANGANGEPNSAGAYAINGGAYGGGGGGSGTSYGGGYGGQGAVRIIWGGTNVNRAFPTTNTGNL